METSNSFSLSEAVCKNKLLLLDLENYVPESNEIITKDKFISYVVQLLKFYNDRND